MTTAIGITLLIGFGAGLVLGVPVGRTWERIRPRKTSAEAKEKKKRR
jgi:hypothetical protein